MRQIFNNNAQTTLSAAINTSTTTITVADGSVFSTPTLGLIHPFGGVVDQSFGQYEMLGIKNQAGDYELVRLISRTGSSLTVQRGQEGTTPTAFAIADTIFSTFTKDSIAGLFNPIETITFNEIEDNGNYDFYFIDPFIWGQEGATFLGSSTNTSARIVFNNPNSLALPNMTFFFEAGADGQALNFYERDNGGIISAKTLQWVNDTPPFQSGKTIGGVKYAISIFNGDWAHWQTTQIMRLPHARTYNGIKTISINNNTTLNESHLGAVLQCTGNQTITIPSSLATDIVGKASFAVEQLGVASPSVVAGGGVTLKNPLGVTFAQDVTLTYFNQSGNVWKVQ